MLFIDKPALTLINLVKLQIISLFLGTLVLAVFAKGYFYPGFETDRQTILRMFHFGKYIFGTNVFSSFGKSADQFISAGLISADVVAYYNIVSRINNMMDVPSLAIADVLFPKNVEAMVTPGPRKCVIILKEWWVRLSVFCACQYPDFFISPFFYHV